jgi:hypothetical protein
MGSYIFVRLIRFPSDTVRAVTLPNDDGTFDIYINERLPEELQQKALEHELKHIRKDHFYNEDPVWVNEEEANK